VHHYSVQSYWLRLRRVREVRTNLVHTVYIRLYCMRCMYALYVHKFITGTDLESRKPRQIVQRHPAPAPLSLFSTHTTFFIKFLYHQDRNPPAVNVKQHLGFGYHTLRTLLLRHDLLDPPISGQIIRSIITLIYNSSIHIFQTTKQSNERSRNSGNYLSK